MCQVCSRTKDKHTNEERDSCKKIINQRNRHTRSWLRLRKIGPLIEKYYELSSVALAERLEMEEGIKTSFWTIERSRNEILEVNSRIGWDSNSKQFYLQNSLSQNKGEITSTEATIDGNVLNLPTKDKEYLN